MPKTWFLILIAKTNAVKNCLILTSELPKFDFLELIIRVNQNQHELEFADYLFDFFFGRTGYYLQVERIGTLLPGTQPVGNWHIVLKMLMQLVSKALLCYPRAVLIQGMRILI